MELTKKSEEDMYSRDEGVGVVFVKTGGKEITKIEFNLGKDNRFYTMDGTELAKRITELSLVTGGWWYKK